jgi:hypothetical protein
MDDLGASERVLDKASHYGGSRGRCTPRQDVV